MSSLIIEPLYKKDYVRLLPDNFFAVTPPSSNSLNFGPNDSFAYQIVFRCSQVEASGWYSILDKTGAGVGGGTDIGYKPQINLNTGGIRTSIKYDLSAPDVTEVYADGLGFNDGKIYNVIFTFDRTVGEGYWYYYVGVPLSVSLNSSGRNLTYVGEDFSNDGDFEITSATLAERPHIDIFLVRLFHGLDLNDPDIIEALDSDLTRPIDTFGIPELVYTDDPGATPGCVGEWARERPTSGGTYYWRDIKDTSGNDLDLVSNGSDNLYNCWGDHPLPKDKGELDVSFWDARSRLPKATAIVPKAKRQGGVETTFSTIKQRILSLKGHFYDITRAEFEAIRNPVIGLLNHPFNSLRDPNLADAPFGFLIFDSIDSINENLEFIPRPNRMSRMEFNLLAGDPGWHNNYYQTDPVTVDAAGGWENFLDIDYQGNLEIHPRVMLFSDGALMGPVYVENLTTGKAFYIGLNTSDVWLSPLGIGDATGKCIHILCDKGRVYWNDFDNSRIEHFTGEFFELVPGNNRIRFFVDDVVGNADLIAIVDYWEKNI